MLEAVIDTNVFISGLLKGGTTGKIIDALTNNKFRLITSHELLDELNFTSSTPPLSLLIPEFERIALIEFIKEEAHFVNVSHPLSICRDPKDNIFLACALKARAHLVTGDKDILVLSSEFKDLHICTPSEFLALLT